MSKLREVLEQEFKKVSKVRQFFENRSLTSFTTTVGAVKTEFQTGGKESFYEEDDGSETYTVYKFTLKNESCFVRFSGNYTSYNGLEYETWNYVVPKEITIVQFVEE